MRSLDDAGDLAAEVSRIGALPDGQAERAPAMLEPLHRLLPFDGAWLALRDEEHRGHSSLVGTGWDRRIRTATYVEGPVLIDEMERLGMTSSQTPLRVAELPSPASELRSRAERLLPAGFRDGPGVCLFAPDGRHLGFRGLFTASPAVPTDAARDLLAALSPTLAQAVDPLRSAAATARTVRSATAAVLLTHTGEAQPLPGLGDPGQLAARREDDDRAQVARGCPRGLGDIQHGDARNSPCAAGADGRNEVCGPSCIALAVASSGVPRSRAG